MAKFEPNFGRIQILNGKQSSVRKIPRILENAHRAEPQDENRDIPELNIIGSTR